MGGGGLLGTGLFASPQTVATPDYTGAAQATAQGNLEAARAATAANRVNQVTPYGSLNYSITGQDPYGNPTWTATQSLSPEQQQLLDYQNKSSLGLGKLQEKGLGYVSNMLDKPFDTASLASVGINPGETYSDAIVRRMQPNIEMQRQALQAQLANQGIMQGSQAYENAMRMQQQKENDLMSSAIVQGMNTGLSARQQGLQEAAYLRNEPINTLNAVRTGSQVSGPTFVNPAQQATTAGADLLGATQAGYNAQLGAANARNAANAGLTGGLMSLGGSLGSAAILASDIRTKENIKEIGYLPNGIPVYEFEYKAEYKDQWGHGKQIGVIAQEVEKVMPQAVTEHPDGYKMVDYGVLNG